MSNTKKSYFFTKEVFSDKTKRLPENDIITHLEIAFIVLYFVIEQLEGDEFNYLITDLQCDGGIKITHT